MSFPTHNHYTGRTTSNLSVASIGLPSPPSAKTTAQELVYKREAGYQAIRARSTHPSKTQLYMQTMYPQTIRELQGNARLQVPTPRELKDVSFPQGRMNDSPGGFVMRTRPKAWNDVDAHAEDERVARRGEDFLKFERATLVGVNSVKELEE